MVRRAHTVDEVKRETLVAAALPVGALASFFIAAVTVPFQGQLAGEVLLSVMVVIVGVVGVVAGRLSAVVASVMAAFSFDFFHVEPIRVLHLWSLLGVSLLLAAVAVVSGWRTSRRATTTR